MTEYTGWISSTRAVARRDLTYQAINRQDGNRCYLKSLKLYLRYAVNDMYLITQHAPRAQM